MSTPAVSAVTIERLAQIFAEMDADYAIINKDADGDPVLQTGLPHIIIHFEIDDDTLSAFATWEGRCAAAREDEVARTIADINWSMPVPNLSYVVDTDPQGGEEILIGASRAMAIGEGLSRPQLEEFISSTLDSFGGVFDYLSTLFPGAAPWNRSSGENEAPASTPPVTSADTLDFPAVTPARIAEQLAADVFAPTFAPGDENIVVAQHNDLDWLFSLEEELVKVECVLPTQLSAELAGEVLRDIANEVNASAFDGRAVVGTVAGTADGSVDDQLELRGDANFVVSAGMSDEQLFHSLNFAVVAAQDALLNTLDRFNAAARELTARD